MPSTATVSSLIVDFPSTVVTVGAVKMLASPEGTAEIASVAPLSLVNCIVGWETFDLPSPLMPLSLASVSENGVSSGATLSAVTACIAGVPVLPAASVALALRVAPKPKALISALLSV